MNGIPTCEEYISPSRLFQIKGKNTYEVSMRERDTPTVTQCTGAKKQNTSVSQQPLKQTGTPLLVSVQYTGI